MKHLFSLVTVILLACNKPAFEIKTSLTDQYYKVVAVDKDGEFTESEIVHLATSTSKNEDDHHGGCGPLPVKFTSIAATLTTIHTAEIRWEIEDEVNVQQYEVEQSVDAKNWNIVRTVLADSSKSYSVIIKI